MTQEVLTSIQKLAAKKIRQITHDKLYIKMLLYGEPGAGKTYLACTAPNALLLLTEPNIAEPTLLALQREHGITIPIWDITTEQDLDEVYEYLESGKHPYKTVIIDGLTDLNTRIKRGVMDEQVDFARSKGRYHDSDSLEQFDWNKVAEKFRKQVRRFRDLPMHVVTTALAMDALDKMRVFPHIQPKSVAPEIRAYHNIVGYLQVKEVDSVVVRRLIVQELGVYAGKNPGNALPPVVENPDLGILFPYIINTLTGKEEKING